MTMRYTYVATQLPESKMRLYPTRVINIIGGPGCGKSLFSSAIILYLTLHKHSVEMIPDYARSLVWQKDYDALKNQYLIAQQQFRMLELMDGQVQFLVNECSMPQLMYYNEHYEGNVCDVNKTRDQMREWYKQFNNVNVLVDRGEMEYVHTGRFQDAAQARVVDQGLRGLLAREGIRHTVLKPVVSDIHAFTANLLNEVGAALPAQTAD